MPQRPRSAFFMPNRNTSACAVFYAFAECNTTPTDIQCLQRKLNGEVVVTFKSIAAKEQFIHLNSLNIDSEPFNLQDIDKPLTFLTIYDAPFELSDLAIIKRPTPYCEVIHYRRGKQSDAPNIYNGLRHYRVRIIRSTIFLLNTTVRTQPAENAIVQTISATLATTKFASIAKVLATKSVIVHAPYCAVFVSRKVTLARIANTPGCSQQFMALTPTKIKMIILTKK